MRTSTTLLCVLLTACSVNPERETPPFDTDAASADVIAQSEASPGPATLGEAIPGALMIVLNINTYDGFAKPPTYILYTMDVVAKKVSVDDKSLVASQDQVDAIVAAVSSTPFRNIPECIGLAEDGTAYPPVLTVGNATTERTWGVSDLKCAESDHDAYGDVIFEADYLRIRNAFDAALGTR